MWLIQSGFLFDVHMEFLVKGHSYLPCDRVFGVLEKKFKTFEHINTPAKYRDIISSSTVSTSVTMEHQDLLNIKQLLQHVQFRTANEVLFSKSREIHLSHRHPWEMLLITPTGSEYVDLNRRSNRNDMKTLPDFMGHQLNPKYQLGQQITIGESNVIHLKKLYPFLSVPGRQWVRMVELGQRTAGARPRSDANLPPNVQLPPDEERQEDTHADQYSDIPEPNIPHGYVDDPPASESEPGPSSSGQATTSAQSSSGKGQKRIRATEPASDKSGKRQRKK